MQFGVNHVSDIKDVYSGKLSMEGEVVPYSVFEQPPAIGNGGDIGLSFFFPDYGDPFATVSFKDGIAVDRSPLITDEYSIRNLQEKYADRLSSDLQGVRTPDGSKPVSDLIYGFFQGEKGINRRSLGGFLIRNDI